MFSVFLRRNSLLISVYLCLTELASKVQEEQEEVESNVNLDSQSHVLPNPGVPDKHSSEELQSDGYPPDETVPDKSPDHVAADCRTWNGTSVT